MTVGIRVMVQAGVRFAFCSLGFSFTEYVRERVDAVFDFVPLDEALQWSLCWSNREAAGQREAAGWRGWAGAAGKLQVARIRVRVRVWVSYRVRVTITVRVRHVFVTRIWGYG